MNNKGEICKLSPLKKKQKYKFVSLEGHLYEKKNHLLICISCSCYFSFTLFVFQATKHYHVLCCFVKVPVGHRFPVLQCSRQGHPEPNLGTNLILQQSGSGNSSQTQDWWHKLASGEHCRPQRTCVISFTTSSDVFFLLCYLFAYLIIYLFIIHSSGYEVLF